MRAIGAGLRDQTDRTVAHQIKLTGRGIQGQPLGTESALEHRTLQYSPPSPDHEV